MTKTHPLADQIEEMQHLQFTLRIETKKLSKLTGILQNWYKLDDTEAVHVAGRKVQAAVVAVEAAVAALTEAENAVKAVDNEDGRYYSEEEFMWNKKRNIKYLQFSTSSYITVRMRLCPIPCLNCSHNILPSSITFWAASWSSSSS